MTDETTTDQVETTAQPESQPEQTGDTAETVSMPQKAFTARLRRAEESAVKTFLGTLGFDKPDDFKAFIEAAKKREQAEMTDAERLKAELETERQKSAAALETAQKAEARRIEAIRDSAIRIAAQAANAKVPDDVLMYARTQDLGALVSDDGEPDVKAIAKLIDTVKKDRAHWFGNGGSGTPGSPSNAGGTTPDQDKKAKQGAAARMQNFVRNSF